MTHKHELLLTFPSAGPPGCTALTKSPESRAATKGDVSKNEFKKAQHAVRVKCKKWQKIFEIIQPITFVTLEADTDVC